MKKILLGLLLALVLLTGVSKFVLADGANVNLTVKNNGEVVYSGSVSLLPAGTISINDSSGNPHDTNADSVLSIVNTADVSNAEFNISNLIYYDTFGAFYLKCISVSGSDLCDNWQYKVNGESPSMGMDSDILIGGENVVLYFGDENKTPPPTPEPEAPPAHSSGGSGYIKPSQPILPPPVILPPSPASLPPTFSSSNINLAEKPKIQATSIKTPKKIVKNIKPKLASQITATAINAVISSPVEVKTETQNKSWFTKLLENIFSIF